MQKLCSRGNRHYTNFYWWWWWKGTEKQTPTVFLTSVFKVTKKSTKSPHLSMMDCTAHSLIAEYKQYLIRSVCTAHFVAICQVNKVYQCLFKGDQKPLHTSEIVLFCHLDATVHQSTKNNKGNYIIDCNILLLLWYTYGRK